MIAKCLWTYTLFGFLALLVSIACTYSSLACEILLGDFSYVRIMYITVGFRIWYYSQALFLLYYFLVIKKQITNNKPKNKQIKSRVKMLFYSCNWLEAAPYCADYVINSLTAYWCAYNVIDRVVVSVTTDPAVTDRVLTYIPVWPPAASMCSSWCSACCALRKGRSPTQNWNATCMWMQRTRRILDASNYLEARNLPLFCGSSQQKRVLVSSTEVSQSLWRRHWLAIAM